MNRPSSTDPEPLWSRWLTWKWGGVAEFRTVDESRVDVLTDLLAYCLYVWVAIRYLARARLTGRTVAGAVVGWLMASKSVKFETPSLKVGRFRILAMNLAPTDHMTVRARSTLLAMSGQAKEGAQGVSRAGVRRWVWGGNATPSSTHKAKHSPACPDTDPFGPRGCRSASYPR